MRPGIKIGRLFGIQLAVDWSWVFVALLLTWNLTFVFGRWHPGWGPLLCAVVALCAALLFFGSILLHELAHSLVARAHGIPVKSITLWLFGGVSSFEREPPSPGVEFLSAIVGPLTSVLLGLFFLLLGSVSVVPLLQLVADPREAFAALGPLPTLLLWLGPVNIMIGLFNLIPGFPLDGGRVLRSALWAVTKDLHRATRWAAGVGQAIATLFIVAGVAMAFGARVPFFGTGLANGLWLSFIGWFLSSAATQSYRQLVVHDLLADLPVARLMRTQFPTVPAEMPLGRFVNEWLLGTDEQAFLVTDGTAYVGLVSLRDVRRVPHADWEVTTVRAVMTPAQALASVGPNEDVASALQRLTSADVAQLPVVEHGQLLGVLRLGDVVRWLELQGSQGRAGPFVSART